MASFLGSTVGSRKPLGVAWPDDNDERHDGFIIWPRKLSLLYYGLSLLKSLSPAQHPQFQSHITQNDQLRLYSFAAQRLVVPPQQHRQHVAPSASQGKWCPRPGQLDQ